MLFVEFIAGICLLYLIFKLGLLEFVLDVVFAILAGGSSGSGSGGSSSGGSGFGGGDSGGGGSSGDF